MVVIVLILNTGKIIRKNIKTGGFWNQCFVCSWTKNLNRFICNLLTGRNKLGGGFSEWIASKTSSPKLWACSWGLGLSTPQSLWRSADTDQFKRIPPSPNPASIFSTPASICNYLSNPPHIKGKAVSFHVFATGSLVLNSADDKVNHWYL